jgi:tryptophanyl-tRNA synthetase
VGALRTWAALQDSYDNYFFIADLHALTIPEAVHPDVLRKRRREIPALYIASGIDPTRSTIFLQSHVPAHAVLGWIFGCLTPVGWLARMTQYKSKSESSTPSAGLFTYPVLQASDILLYQPRFVPVGEDQRQHIELTRDIAGRFNAIFGELFTIPDPWIPVDGARIMGLDDPTMKMSKSIAEVRPGHAIGLLDPLDTIRRSIMRAVTDSRTAVDRDDLSPAVNNLLVLHQVLSDSTRDQTLEKFDGKGYGVLKGELADIATEVVGKIQSRFNEIMSDPRYIDGVLADGARRAATVADDTLDRAKHLIGLS